MRSSGVEFSRGDFLISLFVVVDALSLGLSHSTPLWLKLFGLAFEAKLSLFPSARNFVCYFLREMRRL